VTRAKRDESKPKRIDDALGSYLKRAGIDEKVEQARVVPEWAERVGEGIANVTRPIRVSDGVLLVAVRSSAWLMELRMMERQILRQLNAHAGRGRIDGIRFVMDGQDDRTDGGFRATTGPNFSEK
jgi:predicted nucleic acid-binding Zn ribbon protein